jgi:hypothetical protein
LAAKNILKVLVTGEIQTLQQAEIDFAEGPFGTFDRDRFAVERPGRRD